jgi:hypothetical protein
MRLLVMYLLGVASGIFVWTLVTAKRVMAAGALKERARVMDLFQQEFQRRISPSTRRIANAVHEGSVKLASEKEFPAREPYCAVCMAREEAEAAKEMSDPSLGFSDDEAREL